MLQGLRQGAWSLGGRPVPHQAQLVVPLEHHWLQGADQAIAQRTLQHDTDFMNSQLKQDVDRALGVPSNKK